MRVHPVDPGERLGRQRRPSDALECLLPRRIGVDADELGAHEPARRGGVVAEQRPQAASLEGGEETDHVLAPFLGKLEDEVGGVVGLHAGEQRGDLLVAPVLDELELVAVLELLEDVGLELGIGRDRGEDLLALVMRRRLDEVGDLRGVELRELRVRHPKPHGGDVPRERLDRGPVEEAARLDPPGERARQHAPDEAPHADVDADHAVPALEPRELDLVRAHEPGTVDVDQLPVEDVLLQQHLLRPPLEVLEIELLGDQRHEAGRDLDDLLRGDEDRASRDGGDDAGDRWIVLVAEADDQVVDAPEPLACRVAQLAADDLREVEDRRRSRGHVRSPSCITATSSSGRSRACRSPSRA